MEMHLKYANKPEILKYTYKAVKPILENQTYLILTKKQIEDKSCSEPQDQMLTKYNPIQVQLKIVPYGHEVFAALKTTAEHYH